MFIAVALMCLSLDVQTCTMMAWKEGFMTHEACEAHASRYLGQPGPQGLIVSAGCFQIPGEDA